MVLCARASAPACLFRSSHNYSARTASTCRAEAPALAKYESYILLPSSAESRLATVSLCDRSLHAGLMLLRLQKMSHHRPPSPLPSLKPRLALQLMRRLPRLSLTMRGRTLARGQQVTKDQTAFIAVNTAVKKTAAPTAVVQ